MRSYTCGTCGAELILNDNTNFTNCLYCGNSVAITSDKVIDLNIKKIIPFAIDREEAIDKFSKIIKDKVIDAKKVYVPVRYCSYEFDFLFYYQYKEEYEDSDGHTHVRYIDAETLLDGEVNNELIFGDSRINYVFLPSEIRNQQRLDFDPVLLKDVSIECADFEKTEKLKRELEEDIRVYGRSRFSDVTQIYNENYFISGINYEPFTTLIPVYIIKTEKGYTYNLPGVNPELLLRKKYKKKVRTMILVTCLLVFIGLMGILMMGNPIYGYVGAIMAFSALLPALLPFILVFYFINRSSKRRKNALIEKFDNYKYRRYEYGNKRKKVK